MKTRLEAHKVVLLGNQQTGKTQILSRFTQNTFDNNYQTTIGVDFKTKTIDLLEPEKQVKLQFWDIAGQERFRSLVSTYVGKAKVFVIVFSVKDRASFEAVPEWIKQTREGTAPQARIYIVGNKHDDEALEPPCVTEEEIKGFLHAHDIPEHDYFAVSAKTPFNITLLFTTIATNLSTPEKELLENTHPQEERTPAAPQPVPSPENVGFLLAVYRHPRFRQWQTQLILAAIVLTAALVITAFMLNATLLPLAVAGVVKGLSATAANTIFGAAWAIGVVAAVSLAASLHARFFSAPNPDHNGGAAPELASSPINR